MSIAIPVCTHVECIRSRCLCTRLVIPHRRTTVVVGRTGLCAAGSSFLSGQKPCLVSGLSAFVCWHPWFPGAEGMKSSSRSSSAVLEASPVYFEARSPDACKKEG